MDKNVDGGWVRGWSRWGAWRRKGVFSSQPSFWSVSLTPEISGPGNARQRWSKNEENSMRTGSHRWKRKDFVNLEE